jgi:succinate-semialdehyde dehydrogenase/glutarate-semialdehyde dehydrogenase
VHDVETRRIDSVSAFALAVLAERAGIPSGVLNVLTGEAKEIGGEMTSNPDVRKITFTGSTEVGRLLMKQSSSTIKKLSLELGGNAPFIVFGCRSRPQPLKQSFPKYRNAGQTCVCEPALRAGRRLRRLCRKLVAAVENSRWATALSRSSAGPSSTTPP